MKEYVGSVLIIGLMLSVTVNGMFAVKLTDGSNKEPIETDGDFDKYEGSAWWGSTRITDYRLGVDWIALPNMGNITWGADADIEAKYNSTSDVLEWSGGNHSFDSNITASNLDIANWSATYAWGDHSLLGYLTSVPDSFDISGNITAGNITTDSITVGNITGAGNITADNVWIPVYLFAHTNATINVAVAGTWYNVTFNESESLKSGILHNHDDSTNDTFTITETGVYDLHGHLSFQDEAASPDSNIVFRFTRNDEEIPGSVREYDLDKKDWDTLGSTTIFVSLTAGDEIKFQFTSDDTTVSLESDHTYGVHKDTAVMKIKRIA